MTNFIFKKLKGYERWGQVLGVIAKLRWFSDNNYLQGFCINYGYNYDEISAFLKISNSIIEGDSLLLSDLKAAYIEINDQLIITEEDLSVLNNLLIG